MMHTRGNQTISISWRPLATGSAGSNWLIISPAAPVVTCRGVLGALAPTVEVGEGVQMISLDYFGSVQVNAR